MKVYIYEKLDCDFRIDFYSGTGFPQDRRILHSHPYHEFSLISAGDITYTSNSCVDRVNEKCFIFSAAHQLHNPFINQDKKYERYQIMFRPDFLNTFIPGYSTIFSSFMSNSTICRLSDKTYNRMLTIMEMLFERFENSPDTKETALEYRILVVELMLLASEVFSNSSGNKRIETNTYIDEVVRYIQTHYSEPIKLDFLASKHFISYTKLTSDFKKNVGMTIGNFITLTRIEAAKSLLRQGYSVKSVASLVGFPGTSYFIKIFKRCTHITPLKFQQNAGNEDL
ncbi:MAG: helix-turn-helix domain-containing protein [Ruminococcaceae bacterium]|nr:helix-turn-helix domain-containing protein [Oscillospiraceae bacterium]